MGALTDLLKEIPLAAVLKEKIAAFEDEKAALKTENAILKDDLRQAKAEITSLKEKIERLTHKVALAEVEEKILTYLAGPQGHTDAESIATALGLHPTRAEYFLRKLSMANYIYSSSDYGDEFIFFLDHKGNEYLVKNNLIP